MKIKILGTGGFFNEGLPFNAFAIDHHVLGETPPDILQSLYRHGIRPAAIDTVFISHVHGDHCFGFPFFFFNWLKDVAEPQRDGPESGRRLLLIGPPGIADTLLELMSFAISSEHSYIADFKRIVDTIEIDESKVVVVPGSLWFGFMRTAHSVPTFSLIAGEGGPPVASAILERARFVYSSDTMMHPGITKLTGSSARLLLFDTNGQKPADVHLCTEELAEAMRQSQLALSVAHDYHGREPVLRGTHVSRQPPESSHGIFFAHDGEEFDI